MTKQHPAVAIFSLAFVLFMDSLGLAILFPLLTALFMNPSESILNVGDSESVRHLYYGITLCVFPLAAFFAAPILGDLSDQTGRKKILLFCVIGTCGAYVIAAIAIVVKSIALFLLARILAGLTAGSQPIAQAAIIDISHPDHKARNLSWVILAISFGWLAGPLIGGFFSDPTLVSWFSPAFAVFIAAILAFINIIMLAMFFSETLVEKRARSKIEWHKGPIELLMAFRMKGVRFTALIFTLMLVSWCLFFSYISLFLVHKFSTTAQGIGLFMMFISVGFSITSLFLLKVIIKYISAEKATAASLGVAGLLFLVSLTMTGENYVLWPIAICVGIAEGVAYTLLLTLFSNHVSNKEQGRIMGISAAIGNLTWAIAAFFGGMLSNASVNLPLLISGIIALISCSLMYIGPFLSKKRL